MNKLGEDITDVRTASTVRTLAELLHWRAARDGQRVGYVFLADGNESPVTYAELDHLARSVAVRLGHAGVRPGQRVLLLYPPGVEFVAAMFGCAYAGVIAVPAYPPDPLRLDRTFPRLVAIAADAAPVAALTTTFLLRLAEDVARTEAKFPALRWIATDEWAGVTGPATEDRGWTAADDGTAGEGRTDENGSDSIALIQYTSGSTGVPKGVMLSNANLLHNLRLIHSAFRLSPEGRGLSWLPPYHDMGLIGGLFAPLYAGMPMWLMSPLDFLREPAGWLELISRLKVTVSGGPNFAYDLCVRKTTPGRRVGLDLRSWQVAFNGAEPIRMSTLERFAAAFAPAGFRPESFMPCYGLAEATLLVSAGYGLSTAGAVDPVALEQGRITSGSPDARPLASSGFPAPDQRLEIVDPHTHERCPADRVGEIWVSGPSVARGYWGRPDESRAVFEASLVDDDGAFLRTGDLGFLRQGELIVTGRRKDLIIVRGRNHYPQDLELTAQRAHPALRPGGGAAFVVDHDGEQRLTVVHEMVAGTRNDAAVPDLGPDVTEVARAIRTEIVAVHELRVDQVVLISAGTLPKTSSGKVRRDACRRQLIAGELVEVGRDVITADQADQADQSSTVTRAALLAMPAVERAERMESYLRAHVAALSGVARDTVVRDLPLLSFGLDSLAAQQLIQQVETDLGVRLPIAQVLAGASLAATAAAVADQVASTQAISRASDSATPNAAAAWSRNARPTTLVRSQLTPGQHTLWLLHQLDPKSSAHITAAAFTLTGDLDRDALRFALDTIVARHPALRTTFDSVAGEPVATIWPDLRAGFAESDASATTESALAARLAADAGRPFDLAIGPLVRMRLYRRSDNENTVLITAHHIVMDFWTAMILGRELAALYGQQVGGPPAHLAPPRASAADVFAWQERLSQGPAGSEAEQYWHERIGAGVTPLNLGGRGGPGVSRPALAASAGDLFSFRLDAELVARLKATATAEGVTLFVLLLAGFQALLHALTGSDDVSVVTPVAARTRPEFADAAGYLMNPVVLRSRAGTAVSFRQLLLAAHAQVVGALEHQDVPSGFLARRYGATQAGLFQTMFVFNRPSAADADQFPAVLLGHRGVRRRLGNVTAESILVAGQDSATDIEMSLTELDGGVSGILRYRTEVLDGAAASRWVEQFIAILDAAVTEPATQVGCLPRADAAQRVQLLDHWAVNPRPFADDVPVPDLIYRQARRTPHAIAVVGDTASLSYLELSDRVDDLARTLRSAGVGAGSLVGVCLDRSPAMVVAILATMRAGAGYVPVDPVNPADRIRDIFADAAVAAVVSEPSLSGKVGLKYIDATRWMSHTHDSAGSPNSDAAPRGTAYVIYTSGSTGRPKGVLVSHQALTNHTLHAADAYEIRPADRVLQFASTSFDASAEEMFPALIRGASLVLRTDAMLASPQAFLRACAAHEVTVLDLPTAYWHDLVLALARQDVTLPSAIRLVVIGGERARADRVAAWREHVGDTVRLVNTYGPTEATIVATSHDITGADDGDVAIGRPIANVRAYVLGDACQPVPVGVVGELYLGGAGLAYGYLRRSALTAQRFVADPFGPPGKRLYRTGDLVRYRPDGTLTFVARIDRQVKIYGHRVELGEVESVLRGLPDVAEAAVVHHERTGQLLAYLSFHSGQIRTAQDIRDTLRARLPGYLVPTRFLTLPGLPRTINGKIDYSRLNAADLANTNDAPADPGQPPRTLEEHQLASIWCEILELPSVSRSDDFFALGGHSLLATRMLARVNELLGRTLPLRAVFESPTVAALGRRLRDAPRTRRDPIPRARRDQPLPASFVQQRIWFLQQLMPDSTNYHVPRALRLRGPVDVATLTQALADLERRHEILRTTFVDVDGDPMQRIHEPRGINVMFVDQSDLPAPRRETWLAHHILACGREPFDLANGPLLRVTVVRLAPMEYVLIVVEHHLIHDGWTQGVFLRDFLEFYAARALGRPPQLPDLPVQYADFAVWQRDRLTSDRLETLLSYWRQRLAGAPALSTVPTNGPRPRVLSSRGSQEVLVIDPALALALHTVGQAHHVTLFMTMFAAFVTVLHAYGRAEDIVVGAGIANRQEPELENILGMVINTVPLRTDLSGDPSFIQLLERVRDTCLEAYAHQDMPLDKLIEALRPARSLSHAPLFQTMFSFLDTPMPRLRLPGISVEVLEAHNQSAKFDLNAVIIPHSESRFGDVDETTEPLGATQSITVLLEYSTDLFDAATVARLLGHYRTVLTTIVDAPHRLLSDLVAQLA